MFPTSLLIEIICLVYAVLYLRHPKVGYWRMFIPFMIFIAITEGAGWSMGALFKIKNHWLYNIEQLGEIYFFTWMFREVFRPCQRIRYILGIVFVTLILVFAVESVKTKIIDYNSQSNLVFSVYLIVCCGVFYYMLLSQVKYENLMKHPEFWLVSGVFVFYFSSTAVTVFFEELLAINLSIGIPLRYFIFTGLNAILYGCWCYAFRCRQRQIIQSLR